MNQFYEFSLAAKWPNFSTLKLSDLQGDSGSPVWKYHMGRAFLIGLFISGESMDDNDNGCTSIGYSNRVSDHIDWILKTIKNN